MISIESRIQKSMLGVFFAAALIPWTEARANAAFFTDTAFIASARATDTAAPRPYVLEEDSALLRDARPGETPIQTLERKRKRAKVARVLTGTGLVLTGPALMMVGAAVATFESSYEMVTGTEDRDDSGPWLMAGAITTGVGVFMLCTKWEAERKWERVVRDRLRLGLHPSGKGALVTLRF